MKNPARCGWVGAWCVVAGFVAVSSAVAQDFEDWQAAEVRSLVTAVTTAARTGDRGPAEGSIEFLPSYLNAADGAFHVPFTLLIDAAVATASNIVTYVAIVEASDAPPAADAEIPEPLFEDAFYTKVPAAGSGPIRASRACWPPAVSTTSISRSATATTVRRPWSETGRPRVARSSSTVPRRGR